MTFEAYRFFEINLVSLNLFSFMLGVSWAFFNQTLFGKKLGLYIFLYYGSLAAWYGVSYHALLQQVELAKNSIGIRTQPSDTEQKDEEEPLGLGNSRWIVSDTLPREWGLTHEDLDKLLKKDIL